MQRYIWILVLLFGCSGEPFRFERGAFETFDADAGSLGKDATAAASGDDGGSVSAFTGGASSDGGSSTGGRRGDSGGSGAGGRAADGSVEPPEAGPVEPHDAGAGGAPSADAAHEEPPDPGTCTQTAALQCNGPLPFGYICTVDASTIEERGFLCAPHSAGEGRYCCGWP